MSVPFKATVARAISFLRSPVFARLEWKRRAKAESDWQEIVARMEGGEPVSLPAGTLIQCGEKVGLTPVRRHLFMHYTRDAGDWPDTWIAPHIELTTFCTFEGHSRYYRVSAVLEDGKPRLRFEEIGRGRL